MHEMGIKLGIVGIVAHPCHLSTEEPGRHQKFTAGLENLVRLSLKIKTGKKNVCDMLSGRAPA